MEDIPEEVKEKIKNEAREPQWDPTVGSRYFPYYTRPWISNRDFEVSRDPSITADEARAVDSAIDQYNDTITAVVADARGAGRDWYLRSTSPTVNRGSDRSGSTSPD